MKNVPAPRSCAAAAHPASAHLFFPLIALALLLFAWPDPAAAKRVVEEGSFGSKISYNSDCNKPAPAPAMTQQTAPNAPSRFGGLGGMFGGRPMMHEGNSMERACLDELARQMNLDPPFKMKRERQATHEHV